MTAQDPLFQVLNQLNQTRTQLNQWIRSHHQSPVITWRLSMTFRYDLDQILALVVDFFVCVYLSMSSCKTGLCVSTETISLGVTLFRLVLL